MPIIILPCWKIITIIVYNNYKKKRKKGMRVSPPEWKKFINHHLPRTERVTPIAAKNLL